MEYTSDNLIQYATNWLKNCDVKDRKNKPFITLCNEIIQLKNIDIDILNRSKAKKYNSKNLDDIIRDKKDEDIIIYIEEADRYIIFEDVDEYRNFLENCDKELVKYQIVLVNDKQKLIFLYRDVVESSDIDKLCKHIEGCFGKSPSILYNDRKNCCEITIDIPINNFTESNGYFAKLREFINLKDHTLVKKLKLNESQPSKDIWYSENRIEEKSFSLEDIIASLKTYKDVSINFNIVNNTVNNYGKVTNLTANGNINNAPTIEQKSSNWIETNPPLEKQAASEYYNKYEKAILADGGKPLSIQKFSKMIKDAGFKSMHGDTFRSWKKV